MRKLSIMCACAAGLFAGQTSLAGMQWEFCMARANTGAEQYDKDSAHCGYKATRPVWKSCHGSKTAYAGPPQPGGGPPQVQTTGCGAIVDARPRPAEYIACMAAMGYQEIPNGCRAAKPNPN